MKSIKHTWLQSLMTLALILGMGVGVKGQDKVCKPCGEHKWLFENAQRASKVKIPYNDTTFCGSWVNNQWTDYETKRYAELDNDNWLTNLVIYALTNGVWKPVVREEMRYNSRKDAIYYASYYWIDSLQQMILVSKLEADTTANGFVTKTTSQSYENGIWVNNYQTTYINDANGNHIEEVFADWNVNSQSWDSVRKEINTYQGNNLSEKIEQEWDSAAWKNDAKYLYLYNASNLKTRGITQDWKTNTSSWINTGLDSTFYDTDENVIGFIGKNWSTNTWVNSSLTTNTISNGFYVKRLDQRWNSTSNVWVNTNQENYTISNGKYCGTVYQKWVSNQWENESYCDFTDCKKIFSAIEEKNDAFNSVVIYPNPATSTLSISTNELNVETLSIYSLAGEKLSEQTYSEQIDISALAKGVYFLELKSQGAVGRKRFVKM